MCGWYSNQANSQNLIWQFLLRWQWLRKLHRSTRYALERISYSFFCQYILLLENPKRRFADLCFPLSLLQIYSHCRFGIKLESFIEKVSMKLNAMSAMQLAKKKHDNRKNGKWTRKWKSMDWYSFAIRIVSILVMAHGLLCATWTMRAGIVQGYKCNFSSAIATSDEKKAQKILFAYFMVCVVTCVLLPGDMSAHYYKFAYVRQPVDQSTNHNWYHWKIVVYSPNQKKKRR